MTLKILQKNGDYYASVSPPDSKQAAELGPLPRSLLYDELERLGCHPVDIEVAFNEAEGKFPPPPVGARR